MTKGLVNVTVLKTIEDENKRKPHKFPVIRFIEVESNTGIPIRAYHSGSDMVCPGHYFVQIPAC